MELQKRSCRGIALACAALFLRTALGAQNAATELRIHPADEAGQPARLSKAELYLDVWGGGERIALAPDEAGVRVPLDRSWLCSERPALCQDQYVEGRVLLQAQAFAPVVSGSFLWMGSVETPGEEPRTVVTVTFLNGAWMSVAQGESKQLTIPLRRPRPRKLRFVNPAGEPVAGVRVRASLLLAASNPCGSVEGEPLAEGLSDAAGEFIFPDADAVYSFELAKAHHALADPQEPDQNMRIIGAPSGPVSTVVLRELEKRPLQFRITGGENLAGLQLSACRTACSCGACCGTLGESDDQGRIDIEDFHPEEYERLTLTDREGRQVWQSAPRALPDGPIVIQMPKVPPELRAPVPLERR
ncbi:MAG TPA: hypothetical protein VNN17_01460 [Terriglobia bacterium]|nr:hypothetical protein [Terriglobia bacterium]